MNQWPLLLTSILVPRQTTLRIGHWMLLTKNKISMSHLDQSLALAQPQFLLLVFACYREIKRLGLKRSIEESMLGRTPYPSNRVRVPHHSHPHMLPMQECRQEPRVGSPPLTKTTELAWENLPPSWFSCLSFCCAVCLLQCFP